MSLINVNNAQTVRGQVRSVQLSDPASTIVYLSEAATSERAAYLALTYSASTAQRHDLEGVAYYLRSALFDGEMSLYRLQSMLNSSHWQQAGLIAEVEFGINTTGHGDVADRSHEIVLLVKTTWQEEEAS